MFAVQTSVLETYPGHLMSVLCFLSASKRQRVIHGHMRLVRWNLAMMLELKCYHSWTSLWCLFDRFICRPAMLS